MFWLALIPLMTFFLALFGYATTVEGEAGTLLQSFSFYGGLYVAIPLLVGIPSHAPPVVRGLIRVSVSAVCALESATASLVRAAAYIARLVGGIILASANLAHTLASAILAPIKSALAFFYRLIVRVVSAWRSLTRLLLLVISPPITSLFTHTARLIGGLVRGSVSLAYQLFSLIIQAIKIYFAFTARLTGWIARALGSVANKLVSLTAALISGVSAKGVRLARMVVRESGSVGYKILSVIFQLITGPVGRVIRSVRSLVHKLFSIISTLIVSLVSYIAGFAGWSVRASRYVGAKLISAATPAVVSLLSYIVRSVGWVIRGSGSVTRKAYSATVPLVGGVSARIARSARAFIRTFGSSAQVLSSVISSLVRGAFDYADKGAHMLLRAFRSLIHTLFSVAVSPVRGLFTYVEKGAHTFIRAFASIIRALFSVAVPAVIGILAYTARLARIVERGLKSLARMFLLVIAEPTKNAFAFIARLVAWVMRGLGFVFYRLVSLPIALIVSLLAHGMRLVTKDVRASASAAQGVIMATRPFVREVLAQSIRLIVRVIRAFGLVLYRRLGASGSLVLLLACLLVGVVACLPQLQSKPFRIIAGSGNKDFEDILKKWGNDHNVDIQITYKGSLDIMGLLKDGSIDYDAIWDADSLWTSMGDVHHLIKDRESIMRSPVVFGVKRSIAEKLGWIGKEVSIQEILAAAESEKLRVWMTSATQSNSGASAYFGFLYAFAQPKDVLTSENLRDPEVRAKMQRLLATIDRTSDSSGTLRDLCEKEYDRCDAMFNYESHIIKLDQKLVQSNRAPLYIIYPTPGLGIADFPFSYVDRNRPEMEKTFLELQKYLLSDDVQKVLAARGRRVGLGGTAGIANPAVFNPNFGVDLTRGVSALRMPDTPVIWEALDLYQTALRKSSFTVYLLDFSGSMGQATGNGDGTTGAQQLKNAMSTLLDQQAASKYLLQGSPDDVTRVLAFDDTIINENELNNWTVEGNDPVALKTLLSRVQNQSVRNRTNIYLPVARALEFMKAKGIGNRLPAIILMTDGQSNTGDISEVKDAIAITGLENVPVFGITFGDADPKQLQDLANLTGGQVFDGTKDLLTAFRKAKGNN